MSPDPFDELAEGLDPAERDRLRRVHELLVQAGPPAELPAGLATLPTIVIEPEVARFPPARRRFAAAIAIAAALAAAAFGGYAVGHGHGAGGTTVRVAVMRGANALASLRVGAPDAGGNWPVDFSVKGLAPQTGHYAYYEIFVLRNGEPSYPCGGFRVVDGHATKRFWVPYTIDRTTKWVVTAVNSANRWPGLTVMTTA